MTRYLITHSLLSAWLYAMRDDPYEDSTEEANPYEDLLRILRREPTPQTDAMLNGLAFESMVTAIASGKPFDEQHPWATAAQFCAAQVAGGAAQYSAKRDIIVNGIPVLLYGRIDFLKAGTVIDTKFSHSYQRGKYFSSTQHSAYLCLVPEANSFVYLISNGVDVWTEVYTREETPPIEPTIADFFAFLHAHGLWDIYTQYWTAL